jgi:phosphoglycolate phosphatase
LIKLCIFDLDGTLVNSLVDLAHSTNYALAKHGLPLRTLDEYRVFVSDGLPRLVQRALGDAYTPDLAQDLIVDFTEYYALHYLDNTRCYDGVPELLQELRHQGVQLSVVSNKPDHFLQIVVDHMFPPQTFALVQGNNERFPLKPDPAALNHVLQTLAISPGEALYIGDSGVDMVMAHNGEVKAVGVSWGFRDRSQLEAAGADYIVSSPREIVDLIRPGQAQ